MSENKTKPTDASVDDYLTSRASEQQLADCRQLMALLKKITRQSPRMWGSSIVGYGSHRYTSDNGRTGEMPMVGFAIRGRDLVVYLLADDEKQQALLARLGKHSMGKSCLYFRRLDDLDASVLEQLVIDSIAGIRARFGGGGGAPATGNGIHADTTKYNRTQSPANKAICQRLATEIDRGLPEAENTVWHAHPVWFLDGNPIVGYSKLKDGVRLLFWSGQSFKAKGLKKQGAFKAAEITYSSIGEVDPAKLARWLSESRDVQWDYKNIVRRKGRLVRLK